jgi:hypothetical protein
MPGTVACADKDGTAQLLVMLAVMPIPLKLKSGGAGGACWTGPSGPGPKNVEPTERECPGNIREDQRE